MRNWVSHATPHLQRLNLKKKNNPETLYSVKDKYKWKFLQGYNKLYLSLEIKVEST